MASINIMTVFSIRYAHMFRVNYDIPYLIFINLERCSKFHHRFRHGTALRIPAAFQRFQEWNGKEALRGNPETS